MAEKRKDKDGRILPENVTQRKDGTYMWRKSVDGKSYCLYAKTLGEIKQKRNVALGEIEKGEFKGKHEKMREERELAKRDITLNEWFFQWEKVYRVGAVKESTLNVNHRLYLTTFSDNLGRMKIKKINQIDVADILNSMDVSNNTMRHYVSILNMIFNDAVSNGLVDTNPVCGALRARMRPAKEKRVLSEQEEIRFIEFVRNDNFFNIYAPFFIVAFGTGLRKGEMLALTWDDIDFENNVIHINKTAYYLRDYFGEKGHRTTITTPKTEKSNRDVPMLGRVKEALIEQKEKGYPSKVIIDGYKNFVFATKAGTIIKGSSLARTICNILNKMNTKEREAAELEGRHPIIIEHFSPHCIRHTFATRCYEKGMREKVIQKILGHSKIDMTLNVYTHTTDEMIKEDLQKME